MTAYAEKCGWRDLDFKVKNLQSLKPAHENTCEGA